MTQQEFHDFIDSKCDQLPQAVRSVEFYRGKAIIQCWDNTMLKYSYTPIEESVIVLDSLSWRSIDYEQAVARMPKLPTPTLT